MAVANRANISLAIKEQSGGLGSPESGSGGIGIEVLPSTGLGISINQIRSNMIQRSRMSKRGRQGHRSSSASYETELQASGNLDEVLEAVLGGTWVAEATKTESDLTSVTITDTGATLTFGSSVIAEGVYVGMMVKFADLSVSANNGVWVPVLAISTDGTVVTTEAGLLADNSEDSDFDLVIARHLYTTTPYTDRYFTVDEYLTELDRSKLGTDMKFNSLSFDATPDEFVRIGFGLMGIDMTLDSTGNSPVLTSPTFTDGPSLTLLDGGAYIAGSREATLTGVRWGLDAPANTQPVIGQKTSPDLFLGQFDTVGEFTGCVEDGDFYDLMDAETPTDIMLHCAEDGADPADFVSFYLPGLVFGGWQTPGPGNDGAVIQTVPLWGGEDERGGAYLPTSLIVSTSAT